MICEYCKNTLIAAIDYDKHTLVLVESLPFYGPTYGHPGDTIIDGVVYEIVRPLPRSLILHSAVCQADVFS